MTQSSPDHCAPAQGLRSYWHLPMLLLCIIVSFVRGWTLQRTGPGHWSMSASVPPLCLSSFLPPGLAPPWAGTWRSLWLHSFHNPPVSHTHHAITPCCLQSERRHETLVTWQGPRALITDQIDNHMMHSLMCCARFTDMCARQMLWLLWLRSEEGGDTCYELCSRDICGEPEHRSPSHLPHLSWSHCPGQSQCSHIQSSWHHGGEGEGMLNGSNAPIDLCGAHATPHCHNVTTPVCVTFTLANTASLSVKRDSNLEINNHSESEW